MVRSVQALNGHGLDLSNIDHTTQQEIDAYLTSRWKGRGPLYDQYAMSLMLDYAPDFAKLHWRGAEVFRTLPSDPETYDPAFATPNSIQQLHSYMVLGWETGIRNQFRVLRRLGFTRGQIMEIVMFGRLVAGMRGLGHVYHAVGDMLPDYADGHGNPTFPGGWEADPLAFRSGLDLDTNELTDHDRKCLADWYERTIGYVPKSVQFGMRWDPQLLKVHRAMWERAIKTLPKQVAPYLMLRDATLNSDRDALREAALLGKAWGLTPDWIIRGITQTVQYFTGLRGMYAAYDAVDDILSNWEDGENSSNGIAAT
ncbi:MAG: hypothetical protein JO020_01555 [Chloroflexi bacterium]|nr:hypothetical protein [Chloroflexota bacterium]